MEKTIQTVAACLLKENEIMAEKLCSDDFKTKAYDIPDELRKVIDSMRVKSNTEIICWLIGDVSVVIWVCWTIISLAYLAATS